MPPSILIIEDEEPLIELLSYNLAATSYNVTAAKTVTDGEHLLSERTFDLLLLDWMLPDKSGLDLCASLKLSERHSSMPIIMLTARSGDVDRAMGLATGADDYIVKPFSVPELLARIKELLRRAST